MSDDFNTRYRARVITVKLSRSDIALLRSSLNRNKADLRELQTKLVGQLYPSINHQTIQHCNELDQHLSKHQHDAETGITEGGG